MRKKMVRILTGMAIVLVALGLIYAIAVVISAAKLRRAYAALEAAGRPMNAAEVIPPKVPEAENAAPLYESALLLLKAQPAPEKNLLNHLAELSYKLLRDSLDVDTRLELEVLIGQDVVTQALSTVEEASLRSSCRFDRDYDAGMYMPMPQLKDMWSLVRILGAKAYIEAKAGHPDIAWNLVQTQLRLADAWKEPVIVGQLVRIILVRLSCDTIQKLCEIAPPTRRQSLTIENALTDLDDITCMVLAADGERLLFGEWMFKLPRNELREVLSWDYAGNNHDEPGLLQWLQFRIATFKPIFLADHAAYLRLMGDFAQSVQHPYSLDEVAAMDTKLKDMARHHINTITTRIVPAIGDVKRFHSEMSAYTRITRTGLALLREKQTSGVLPAALDVLKLQNINDPFSEGPLLYKTEGRGFILYSVGKDQKDNGGIAREPEKNTDYDLVWRFVGQ